MASKSKYVDFSPKDIRSGDKWEIFYHLSFKTLLGYEFPPYGNPIFSPEEVLNVANELIKKGYKPKIAKTIMSRIPAFGKRTVFHRQFTPSKLEKELRNEKRMLITGDLL